MARTDDRGYRVWETLLVSALAAASLYVVTPVVALAMRHPEQSENRAIDFGLELSLEAANLSGISGLAYALAEVECRSWHRNRPFRPFNFLLKQ